MFFIQQTTQHDCGFTALKILLANLNKDENYIYLPSPFSLDKDVSLLDLMKEGEHHGVILKASRVIDKTTLSKNDKLPFIPVIKEDGNNHAVYLYKINNSHVYFYDPLGEEKKMKKEDFFSIWTGDFLRIESFTKKNCPFKKPILIKKSERLISLLFTFISALCCIFGVYFINKDSYFFVPLIFFSGMIIIEILLKQYSIFLLKRMDKRIEPYFSNIKGNDYYLYHSLFEKYKSSLLINDITYFSSFGVIIIISIIMLINDKTNIVYLLGNVILGSIYVFILEPYLKKKENHILKNENKLKLVDDSKEAFNIINDIRINAYNYGNIFHVTKYIFIFIQIVLSFVMMMVMNLVNVSYIICYTILEVYFYNHFVDIFISDDNMKKNDSLLVKLLALFEKEE